ncbi:enoyl-CoA hydratase [Hellea sp.]|jgi:enoyl-CoA hydratase|nr:enoyl-CoA hydratase [Hellea sp.]MDA8888201.1 enoyl-CoA hydratase [Hellea sp.]MDB4844017.1 enoyl-CoA hydratase [Hellea sp.]MDC0421925.1 enoyl-CoA hydratase [Hellea sp.]MDC0650884.1 enoyl-CoA hydratase [Hellea sp.]MDC1061800.1 enoyl-CoA hydratase [Hellea sp.]
MNNETIPKVDVDVVYEEENPVIYLKKDNIAFLTLNRTKYHNSQNSQMLYALDDAFLKATSDDGVKVIVLKANGKHFSAGHDIGTPGRDFHLGRDDRRSMNYNHDNKPGAEKAYVREQEVYLEFCRRWRAVPKPTIAQVQGGCIAGGLMLAWVCDLIIASDDAFFQDPVVQMGFPGVEYFAHPFELNIRLAKEFLLLGERWTAERVLSAGMINKIVPRSELDQATVDWAKKISQQPRLAMALTKQACNHIEDLQGKRSGMDMVFGYHHFAHANNTIVKGDYIAGFDGKKMAKSNKNKEN